MRVLHLITTLDRGGAENHLVQLVGGQIQAGCSVSVMYLKGAGELVPSLTAIGATVEKAPRLPRGKRIRTQEFDVVHAHLPRAELWARVATRKSRNLVVSRHLAGAFWPGAPTLLSRVASRLAERHAQQVICISQAVREYMISTRHCQNPGKLGVVYYGYSPSGPLKNGNRDTEDSSFDHHRVNLSCIARLVPQKDLPTLVRAIHELKTRGIEAHAKIAGSGPDLASLRKLCAQLEVDHQIEFVGRIDQPEEFIAQSDIFVLPSLFEGFGLVLLEAAAAGIPAIAANNTAMAEVVVDGESGLLFATGDSRDLAEKIEMVARDVWLRRDLAEGARSRLASVFSVARMVDETMKVYRCLETTRSVEQTP